MQETVNLKAIPRRESVDDMIDAESANTAERRPSDRSRRPSRKESIPKIITPKGMYYTGNFLHI